MAAVQLVVLRCGRHASPMPHPSCCCSTLQVRRRVPAPQAELEALAAELRQQAEINAGALVRQTTPTVVITAIADEVKQTLRSAPRAADSLQKTVDAGETALTSMYDGKHYEVSKHAAFTNHGLSTVALLVSEQRWKALPESARQAMLQAERDCGRGRPGIAGQAG